MVHAMASEYDPIRRTVDDPLAEEGLEQVRDLFAEASRPYLGQPWSWAAWSLILPAAALSTPRVLAATGGVGVMFLWSGAVLVGGIIEAVQILGGRRTGDPRLSSLAQWVLRAQGNLSLVAVVVSVALLVQGMAWMLPAIWLLLLGHSLFSLGGLAAGALRVGGLIYQAGGLLAIWPHGQGLAIFAAATLVGNLWIAVSIWRAGSRNR
jgi:hypothetical protein